MAAQNEANATNSNGIPTYYDELNYYHDHIFQNCDATEDIALTEIEKKKWPGALPKVLFQGYIALGILVMLLLFTFLILQSFVWTGIFAAALTVYMILYIYFRGKYFKECSAKVRRKLLKRKFEKDGYESVSFCHYLINVAPSIKDQAEEAKERNGNLIALGGGIVSALVPFFLEKLYSGELNKPANYDKMMIYIKAIMLLVTYLVTVLQILPEMLDTIYNYSACENDFQTDLKTIIEEAEDIRRIDDSDEAKTEQVETPMEEALIKMKDSPLLKMASKEKIMAVAKKSKEIETSVKKEEEKA